MFPRRIGCELAILGVVCVITLFLFPAASGPYTAIHGPVTALRSVYAASKIRLAMILAGLRDLWNNQRSPLTARFWISILGARFAPDVVADYSTILRC